ncbi:MAG: acetate--CoA ligase [Candidatus Hydrothermarchaeaceae archaeon]
MKIDKKLKFEPNLENYEETYKSFNWDYAFDEIEGLDGGKLNAAYEAVDRHAKSRRKNKIALYFESGDGRKEKYTFREMRNLSNKFTNLLESNGAAKGDRVFIFLPRSPELYISFLGTLKMGAIAGTLFSAFGTAGLKDRLGDSGAKFIATTHELEKRLNEVRGELPELETAIIVDGEAMEEGDISYEKEMARASSKYDIKPMNPEDDAFMLYTSGTTGKPKGICHTHKAIAQQHLSAKWILDLKDEDTYWCTADPGWVTGIAYGILGSWSNGVSSVAYGGRFDPKRWYSILEEYEVSVWYTSPTAIRMLMRAGEDVLKKYDLSNLRYVCSVGEPLNPDAVRWGMKELGLPIHDNWWQTETGGILISNYPSLPIKPGSMGKPFPGITATILDEDGNELPHGTEGDLAIKPPWPSMMKEVWKNEEKYKSYFEGDWYLTGDRAWEDEEGYFWFVGRADDVIKTAGERVGPFEVESALLEHEAIVEAGVIGKPDPLRGEIIKAFIVLAKGFEPSEELKDDVKRFVKKRLAGHAYPREMEFASSLPKTRSGKIMRRILKAKELGQPIGDTSTLIGT